MTKEVQNYQEKPGILVAIDADELAHALNN